MKKFLLFMGLPLCAFKLGIENISPEILKRLQSGRVGLVTNQTGIDQQGRSTLDLLRQKGIFVPAVFVPEHGLSGTIKAGADVPSIVSNEMKTPIVSLYAQGAGKIDRRAFDRVDMIVVDLQDVGVRHYTYISTLYTVMQECARIKKPIFVLDRPNPLGAVMEGPICLPHLRSFIGIAEIPLRHGLTMGELAQFFNTRSLTQRADLTVVPLAEYQRDMMLPQLHTHLSPNIKTLASAHGYSFLGLLGEVQPFNVGVGTPEAFQVILLPQSLGVSADAWRLLQNELFALGVKAKMHTVYHKDKKKWYEGLKLSFENMNNISSYKALMTVLAWTKKQGITISFMRTFDKSVGTSAVRAWYQSNKSFDAFMQSTKQQAQDFLNLHQDVLLYQEHPKVVRGSWPFDCVCV